MHGFIEKLDYKSQEKRNHMTCILEFQSC